MVLILFDSHSSYIFLEALHTVLLKFIGIVLPYTTVYTILRKVHAYVTIRNS